LELSVQHRFRPIVITVLTTALGMLPLALGIGEGGDMIAPMGAVVIGGLLSSTLSTLFVIPIFYSYIDKENSNMHKKYMTPDGQVITQKEIDAKKREEAETQKMSPENDESNYDYHDSDNDKAPEIEEYDSAESKEYYINEMQKL